MLDKIELNDAKSTEEKFKKFFIKVESYPVAKIPQSDVCFKSHLPKVNTTLN